MTGIVLNQVVRVCVVVWLSTLVACGGSDRVSAPTPVIPVVQGTWSGDYTVAGCNDQSAPGFCAGFQPVGSVLPVRMTLTQTGQQLTGSVELGAIAIPVTGTVNASSRVVLTGSVTIPIDELSSTVTLVNWDTVVSGSNMTGGWRTTFTIPGFVGAPFVESTIRAVTKTG